MPSESSCMTMLDSLKAGKYSAVSCSLGAYTKSSLQTLIKIHSLRDISKSVKDEMKWLNTTTYAPNNECVLPGFLHDYKRLLLENRDGIVVINDTILTSDLMKLTGNRWLNLAIMQGFVDLFNDNHSETATFILNDLLAFNKENVQKESRFCGKQIRFFTFIINVGGDIKETFVASAEEPGLHWTLLYVDTIKNKWFYCDTLGWAVPKELKSTVNAVLEALSTELPLVRKPAQGRFLAHKPQSISRGSHQCMNTCFKNVPLQTCGNICGVIVAVMAAISCIDPILWRFGFLDSKSTLPSQISWLKKPTSHSCYLRRVLIHWLIAKDVDLRLLGITSSLPTSYNGGQPVDCTFNEGTTSTTAPTYEKEPYLNVQRNAADSCYFEGETKETLQKEEISSTNNLQSTKYCDINDTKDTNEGPQPPMVEYVYSSDEETYEPLRKDSKTEHNYSKHPTIPEVQCQRQTPRNRKTEVREKKEHNHSESPAITDSQDKQRTEPDRKTEVNTEKESNHSESPAITESQDKQRTEPDLKTEVDTGKESNHSESPAITESQDKQRTEPDGATEVNTGKESNHSESPAITESQDKQRTEPDRKTEVSTGKESNHSESPAITESQDKQRTEPDRATEVNTGKESNHSESPAITESQDKQQTKPDRESEVSTGKESNHSESPATTESQDKQRTEPDCTTEVNTGIESNHSESPAITESQDKQQTKPDRESEVKQKKKRLKSSAMPERQDKQQTQADHQSEVTQEEEQQKDGEKHTTNDSSGTFKCPFCNQVCNVKSNLRRHIKRKHADQENNADVQDSGKCQCLDCAFQCHRTASHKKSQHRFPNRVTELLWLCR